MTRNYQDNQIGRASWYDPEANAAFLDVLEENLDLSKSNIALFKLDHINDGIRKLSCLYS
jgi:uncharacterized protein (UPF0261 family)